MTGLDLVRQRLLNQHIAGAPLERPCDVVAWLGAVQAQDYAAAKWAVGQRTQGATDAAIEQAFAEGVILRTHVLRPTWHFVVPADIRWMLALTAPRIHAASAHYYRKLEVDSALLAQSQAVLAKALHGGKQLTRSELVSALQQAGFAGDYSRFGLLIMRAELDGLICSGARRGKQHTYALLDERVAPASTLEREEAVAELARRYFTSHGPATVQDYAWWSGLAMADARAGLDLVKSQLVSEVVEGKTYWLSAADPPSTDLGPVAHLLPNFDEYMVGYTDRSAIYDAQQAPASYARAYGLFNTMVVDGQIVGAWQRTLREDAVEVAFEPFVPLTAIQSDALAAAAQRYGEFLGVPVVLA